MARPKVYSINLTDDECSMLNKVIKNKTTCKTVLKRCQILRDLDETKGCRLTHVQIAHTYAVCPATVSNLIRDYVNKGIDCIIRYILTRGKIYQIKYAVFYLILQVIRFEYVGMKLLLYCIATKFAVECKFCYKRLFCILANLIAHEYNISPNSAASLRKADGRAEAKLIQIACGPAQDGHSRWTLKLLEEKSWVELEPLHKQGNNLQGA